MAEANFYLKKNPDQKKESPINLFFSYDGKRLKYSTGQKVEMRYWNESKQKVKSSYTGSVETNIILDKMKEAAFKIHRTYQAKGESPSTTLFRKEMNEAFKAQTQNGKGFFFIYDLFIESTKSKVKERTTQKYLTLKSHLLEFQSKKNYLIDFDTINIHFYDKLLYFYSDEIKIVNNTTGKYISTLKTFLHWATERGHNKKMDFKKFKVLREEADIVFLEYNELMRLTTMDLSDKPRLDKVRDIFCLGCFTGLRFSDLKKLTPENYRGTNLIINSFKGRGTLRIPLQNSAKEIIEKYLKIDGFLNVISNQKLNDYIKELCQLANIEKETTLVKHKGAKRIEITKPKYKLISSHTARRTFVTLSLELGMRPEIVMKITGHKDYKTFKKYLKLTDRATEVAVVNAWDKKRENNRLKRVI